MEQERRRPESPEPPPADDTEVEESEHAPSRGKPGEDLTEISEEDD